MSAPPALRVALVISAPGWRGSGASFAKVAQGLTERGHDVLVLTGAPRLTARFVEEGLRVRQLPMRDTGPREVWSLLRELRRHGTGVAMADGPRDLRLCAYAALPLRIPLVYRFNLNHRRARNHLMDRVYFRRVRSLVFQSEFARALAYRQSPWMRRAPAPRIPNGYDTARFAPDPAAGRAFRASLGISPEATVVVTPGKLARNKGHDVAFDALRRLAGSGHAPGAYVVLGDGIREQELKALAQELQVPTWFTGFLAPEAVAAALNAADLVVHPSSHEIFPERGGGGHGVWSARRGDGPGRHAGAGRHGRNRGRAGPAARSRGAGPGHRRLAGRRRAPRRPRRGGARANPCGRFPCVG